MYINTIKYHLQSKGEGYDPQNLISKNLKKVTYISSTKCCSVAANLRKIRVGCSQQHTRIEYEPELLLRSSMPFFIDLLHGSSVFKIL